jgi:hypothetical protein
MDKFRELYLEALNELLPEIGPKKEYVDCNVILSTIPSINQIKERTRGRAPIEGMIVITEYQDEGDKDEMFYRAKVLKVLDDEKVRVQFIDYGNEMDVWMHKCYIIDNFEKALKTIPGRVRK